jgi:hypothetical protein
MASTPPPIPFTPSASSPPQQQPTSAPVPVGYPPFAATVAPGATPGLTPDQLKQIGDARLRSKKIRKGVSVAMFDGWTVGLFGGLTLLFGIFSPVGLILGAGMIAIAYVELRGAKRMRLLDPQSPRMLAWNQVVLGGLLLAYASYSLWTIYTGRTDMQTEIAKYPELTDVVGDMDRLSKLIGLLIYGTLMAVAIFGQGGTALFYLSRKKHIEAYLRETPSWIIDAQRSGMLM